MPIHRRVTMTHDCDLPPIEDDISNYIPRRGLCSRFRRAFLELRMVSSFNPATSTYLKSKSLIREEKYRHLHNYYYMIHPFSEFRFYWEACMTLVFTVILIFTPLDAAYYMPKKDQIIHTSFQLVCDVICFVDLVLNFATGYLNESTKEVIMNPKKNAKHYFLTYFWFDFLSLLPIIYILTMINKNWNTNWTAGCFVILKILRVATLLKYFEQIQTRLQLNSYIFKIYKMVIFGIIILIWTSCITYFAVNFSLTYTSERSSWVPPDFLEQPLYVQAAKVLYHTTSIIFLISYGGERSYRLHDMILNVLFLMGGFILHIYILYHILQLTKKRDSASTKYQQILQQLQEYMRYKGLPDHMKRRIISYYDFRYQKTFFKENEILNTISGQLKQEVVLHTCRKLVENVPFFKGLPTTLIIGIVTILRSEIFLPNDIIVQQGVAGDCMFFISSGTVAVYTSSGKEVCHLEDGAHFGEIALIMESEQRIATVIAVEACELFTLDRRDFRRAMEPYPDAFDRMRRQAFERIERTIKMENELNNITPTDSEKPRAFALSQISGVRGSIIKNYNAGRFLQSGSIKTSLAENASNSTSMSASTANSTKTISADSMENNSKSDTDENLNKDHLTDNLKRHDSETKH